ncbi:MAG: aminoacyl-tRNA hydrolase [Stomatobaculum sp.]|nr:aminoacyl-tRNA hydrolase [Stomatobaculum sp.]
MYIIAGLGNPGREYENTRHNVGFHVIDCLADRMRTEVGERKHFALCGKGMIGGEKVLLMKPQTYMNNSGQSLRAAADFYKVPPENILVISDDINLEEGKLRIRMKGSAGGHNGLKSIIQHLGSQDFPRIRVGIGGKPEGWDLADYVLGKLKGNDEERMQEAYRTAADAAECLVTEGGAAAMNRFNTKAQKAKAEAAEKKEQEPEKKEQEA